MRMMLRVSVPVEQGNEAQMDGRLRETVESALSNLNPEAAYFFPDKGQRSCLIFFDMTDASQIPPISEPFFLNLNAKVEFIPVMTIDELVAGLAVAFT